MNPTYVPYIPIQLPANLKFIDASGNPVSQLYPTAINAQLNTPQTSAISNGLAAISTNIDQINQINLILNQYQTTLTSLQNQITAINTSGAVALPNVNAYCLSTPPNLSVPLNVATTLLISNACSYNNVLGTPTALANAILAQCDNLNTLPAFGSNSDMAGLVGWSTSPTTIANTINNQWISYCDARAGITKALAAVTPGCSQVIVDYQAVINNFALGMYFYFQGYTFIPDGFTDNGSGIKITDNGSGILLQNIDIVTLSNTSGPYVVNTSGSTLSSQSPYFIVQVTSNVTNTSLGLTCEKVVTKTIYPAYGPAPIGPNGQCCPDIGNLTYTFNTSGGTTAVTLMSGLSYTPRFVAVTPKDITTHGQFFSYGYWIQYVYGGAILHNSTSAGFDNVTINVDWMAFR